MSNTILLVYEGEKIEGQVFNSIEKFFPPASNGQKITRISFKAEIRQLWDEIKDDADLDIVEVLKQRPGSDIKILLEKMYQRYIFSSIMTVIHIQIQCPNKNTMK